MATQDTIYYNARIWTGMDDPRFVSSFRVRDGRIAELDCPVEMNGSHLVDLGGSFISPGFVDAHLHLLSGGECLMYLDLSSAGSREEFMDLLAEADRQMEPGRWLIASGWSENRWDPPHLPDKSWLACCGDRPVVCWRMDLHAAVVNDAVLEHLNLPDDERLEAEGGRVLRDEVGQLTGILQEAAAWNHLIPTIPPLPEGERVQALDAAHRHCLKLGITSVRSMEYEVDVRALHMPAGIAGRLRVSIVLLDRTLPLSLSWLQEARHDDWFRITGCKSFLDGTLGSRTARLQEPYADDSGNMGVVTEHLLDGTLEEWSRQVVAAGCTPVMHAIGDEAVLAGIKIVRQFDDQVRASIEHAEIVTPAVLEALKKVPGIRLSVQPLHRADDAMFIETALGSDRASHLLPLAELVDSGARLSFGTDWPVVSVDPIESMAAAITGSNVEGKPFYSEQKIEVEQALRSYSAEAAEVAHLDHVGTLSTGQAADFIAWDEDPFQLDWTRKRPRITATFLAGELVEGLSGAGEVTA